MPLLLALTKFIRRPWWIVVLVAALAGGAGYWRGAQQARLVAQATLATRQAECETRQRQQAQATQQALETALARQQQLQGANDRLSAQLETTQHALTLKTQQLHRSIAHAVAHDGAAYTGPVWGLMGCSATTPPSATPPTIMLPCPRPPANLRVLPPMPPPP